MRVKDPGASGNRRPNTIGEIPVINILITNSEGHGATGLTILREAVARALPTAQPTVIIPKRPQPLLSFATIGKEWQSLPTEQVEANVYRLDGTPLDVLTRAFLKRDEFTLRPWDAVFVGVSPQTILGGDIYAHAATALVMAAANLYFTYATAFNQEMEEGANPQDRAHYQLAEKIIPHFLKTTQTEKGRAWNVNLPKTATKHRGYKETTTAHYSPTTRPPTELIPRARDEKSDVTAVAEGYVAITSLVLRVNPTMRY